MGYADDKLSDGFLCAKCGGRGGHVERLSSSGIGISRLFEIQPYCYAYVSCHNCGYTEIYDLKVLEGVDDMGTIVDVIFAD